MVEITKVDRVYLLNLRPTLEKLLSACHMYHIQGVNISFDILLRRWTTGVVFMIFDSVPDTHKSIARLLSLRSSLEVCEQFVVHEEDFMLHLITSATAM